jgi:GH24 family phage-related lysozyme (muramidase)
LREAEQANNLPIPNSGAGVNPATADMSEAEKLGLYEQKPEYKSSQININKGAKNKELSKSSPPRPTLLQSAWNWMNEKIITPITEWVQERIVQPIQQNVPSWTIKTLSIAAIVSMTAILTLCVEKTPTYTQEINATITYTSLTRSTVAKGIITGTYTATIPHHQTYVDIWNTETIATNIVRRYIIAWEGNENFPYNDSTNNCTIGIGHKLHDGPCTEEEIITEYSDEQILYLFNQDIAEAEKYVRKMFQTLDNEFRPNLPPGNPFPITQVQFDALVSFTFNAGVGRLIEVIWAIIQPDTGSFDYELFTHLMLTRYAQGGPGLLIRRQAEVTLFVDGIYP